MSQWVAILILLITFLVLWGAYRIARAIRDLRADFLRQMRRVDDDLSAARSADVEREQALRVLLEQEIDGVVDAVAGEMHTKLVELREATKAKVVEESRNIANRIEAIEVELREAATHASEIENKTAEAQSATRTKIVVLAQSIVELHKELEAVAARLTELPPPSGDGTQTGTDPCINTLTGLSKR